MTWPEDKNPYAAYGTIASGERFVGRKRQLETLETRLLEGGSSAFVVGLPRIGKSSLARMVLDRACDRQSLRRGWLTAAGYETGEDLLAAILEFVGGDISAARSRFPTECKSRLEEMVRSGERALLVVDEFDKIRHWDDGAITFHRIREIIYDPQRHGLAVLFVSRRPVERLEEDLAGVSTFGGVCETVYLSAFGKDEVQALCARGGDEAFLDQVLGAAGGHPFLSEKYLHNQRMGSRSDFSQDYLALGEFLKDEGLEGRLVWLVHGNSGLRNFEADLRLKAYGLWNGRNTICRGFEEFLEHRSLDLNLWSEFGLAEKAVRDVLEQRLVDRYGAGWVSEISGRSQAIASRLKRANDKREADARKWPDASERSLMDYTYPDDLRAIMLSEWSAMKLKKEHPREFWNTRLQALARIRAPLAHGRDDVLSEQEVAVIRLYCSDLIDASKRSLTGR